MSAKPALNASSAFNVSKKALIILLVEILLCFVVCIPLFFFITKVPPLEVPSPAKYKILNGMLMFFDLFPSLIATSIVIGFSWGFGRENIHFERRFSNTAGKFLVQIIIFSLVGAAFSFATAEVFTPLTKRSMEKMVSDSNMIKNYLNMAEEYFDKGEYKKASFYVKQIQDMNKHYEKANKLNIEIEARIAESKNAVSESYISGEANSASKGPKTKVKTSDANKTTNKDSMSATQLIKLAQDCFAQEDYINAHYYANEALELCSPYESNRTIADKLAVESWAHLSQTKSFDDELSSQVFAKKKESYAALISGDYSKAYYNFSDLIQKYPRDYDIKKYYEESREKLSSRCFFMDETENLQKFEQFKNIYFTTENIYGGKDVIYIEGLTSTKAGDKMVMYLRGFSIMSYNNKNYPIFKMNVPYAKLTPAPLENMDGATVALVSKNYKTQLVPYIFLKSVDRTDRNLFIEPEYEYYGPQKPEFSTIYVMPISFERFNTLCDISKGEERMNILSAVSFARDAEEFGFSKDIIAHSLLSRTMYPFMLFVCFLLCGTLAWQTRLLTKDAFHFSWLLLFPFLTLIAYTVLKAAEYICHIVAYAVFSLAGFYSILIAFLIFVLLAILMSVRFVSTHD